MDGRPHDRRTGQFRATAFPWILAALVALSAAGCKSPSSPRRALSAGIYHMELKGCTTCDPVSTPGGLLAYASGYQGLFVVSDANNDSLTADLSGFGNADLDGQHLDMQWSADATGGSGYVASFPTRDGSATITLVVRRAGSAAGCAFSLADLLDPSFGITDGTCSLTS